VYLFKTVRYQFNFAPLVYDSPRRAGGSQAITLAADLDNNHRDHRSRCELGGREQRYDAESNTRRPQVVVTRPIVEIAY
jgi:hypothetical protein